MFSASKGFCAGPFATEPSRLYLLPWQGQSIVPSATLFTVHPACVHFAEKPLNTPAVGWVTTILSTITPEPTGTSAVLAMTLAAGAAVPPDARWPAVVDSVTASGFLPYVEQAASTAVTRPSPAPSSTFCREMGNSEIFKEYLSVRT